jgi:hypothetical protein
MTDSEKDTGAAVRQRASGSGAARIVGIIAAVVLAAFIALINPFEGLSTQGNGIIALTLICLALRMFRLYLPGKGPRSSIHRTAPDTADAVLVAFIVAEDIGAVEHDYPGAMCVGSKCCGRPVAESIPERNVLSHNRTNPLQLSFSIDQCFQFRRRRQMPVVLSIQFKRSCIFQGLVPVHYSRGMELPLQTGLGIHPCPHLFYISFNVLCSGILTPL